MALTPPRAGTSGLLLLLLLGACESGDPRTDGFGGGLHGLLTGAYRQREDQQRAALAGTQQVQAAEERRALNLETAVGQRERRLAALRRDVTALRSETARLREQAVRIGAERSEARAQAQAIAAELAHTQAELDRISRGAAADADPAALAGRKAQLEAEVARLRQGLDSIARSR